MISRLHRLSLLLAAAAFPAAAEEPAKAVPVEEPPAAVGVVEPAPPMEVDPAPQPVAPGGNVEQPQKLERAISRSGMFRVSGGGPEQLSQRSAVALLLEQAKDDFEALIRETTDSTDKQAEKANAFFITPETKLDEFKVPVNVMLVGKPGDPPQPTSVAYDFGNTGESFVLGIRIHLARGIDNDRLERAALNVLLFERALRSVNPKEFDEPLAIRPWLVEGLIEAKKWRANRADRRLYEGVFKQGGGFTLEELFELSEKQLGQLDGASKLTFRALSGALVMALLEQPHGRGAFKAFCGEAARFSGEMPVMLRKHFPELNLSEKSLAKWWALTLARLVAPKLSEVLTIQETEKMLEDALTLHTRDAAGNAVNRGIEEWVAISELEDAERAEAVKPAEEAITRLSYRCFPSYRPILGEYQSILRDLTTGKGKDLGVRIVELTEQRQLRLQRAIRARDFMDFTEISQARELSGQFDDYMKLKKELELRPRAQRKDRVTETLDTMQKTYESRRPR